MEVCRNYLMTLPPSANTSYKKALNPFLFSAHVFVFVWRQKPIVFFPESRNITVSRLAEQQMETNRDFTPSQASLPLPFEA